MISILVYLVSSFGQQFNDQQLLIMPLSSLFLQTAIADANAPKYNPNPIIKLPLKPITIDDIAVNTVPITDAVTFMPQSRVTSSPPLLLLLPYTTTTT